MITFFENYQNSPYGRAWDFHMLRYWGFEVKNYDFSLRCLAYESLRPVQDTRTTRSCMRLRNFTNCFLRMIAFFINYQISPYGRVWDFHMLCYWGFEVKNYDFSLRCLAYESLRSVQDTRTTRVLYEIGKFYYLFFKDDSLFYKLSNLTLRRAWDFHIHLVP